MVCTESGCAKGLGYCSHQDAERKKRGQAADSCGGGALPTLFDLFISPLCASQISLCRSCCRHLNNRRGSRSERFLLQVQSTHSQRLILQHNREPCLPEQKKLTYFFDRTRICGWPRTQFYYFPAASSVQLWGLGRLC